MRSVLSDYPVLIVDDEPELLFSYRTLLRAAGVHNVITTGDSRQVMEMLGSKYVAAVVLDLMMPHIYGADLLQQIVRDYPDIPVIIVTGKSEIEEAVNCMKTGAFDYLVKPVEKSRFVSSVARALELCSLRNEVSSLRKSMLSGRIEHERAFSSIVTRSPLMHSIFRYVEAIADTHWPVLVTGETGVGKELVARAIHDVSGRSGEFIDVNIAGLDDTVFSDTLFGHRKGAFTGADSSREGLLARAKGGTLFLDEIGDLSEASQVKLLRLIQEKKYFQLGEDVPRKSDARIIVATNQNLAARIEEGRFRRDLYYRLAAHHVHIPSIRERREDIPLLVDHFVREAASSLKKNHPIISSDLFAVLSRCDFPGNVRELQSMVYDAVARHRSGPLKLKGFEGLFEKGPLPLDQKGPAGDAENLLENAFGRFPTLKQVEEYVINEALNRAGGNQGIAAAMLGMTRQALNKRLIRKKEGKK